MHRHEMNFYVCPAGYCRCVHNSSLGAENCVYMFVNSNPDAQCDYRRHGKLSASTASKGYLKMCDIWKVSK